MTEHDINIPEAMIERVAQFLFNTTKSMGVDWWSMADHDTRRLWRIKARGVLHTALEDCEVREEWACCVSGNTTGYHWYGGKTGRDQAMRDLQFRQARNFTYPGVVSRRLVVVTHPTEVSDDDIRS